MSQKQDFEDLVRTIQEMKTREEVVNFLEGILTPKELLEIPTRLRIVKMLKEGVSQHRIAEELGIGIATVTRGSKEIQKGKFKYISV
jgi:TrpR family transcriptional regulator, trp operon repressor